jgi:hypothetical protein
MNLNFGSPEVKIGSLGFEIHPNDFSKLAYYVKHKCIGVKALKPVHDNDQTVLVIETRDGIAGMKVNTTLATKEAIKAVKHYIESNNLEWEFHEYGS